MVRSPEARFVFDAVRRLNLQNVSGDLLEAGVWKGGMSMLIALAELRFGDVRARPRTIWLFDTFEGLPAPGANDDEKSKRLYRAITASVLTSQSMATAASRGGGGCASSRDVAACCQRHPRACGSRPHLAPRSRHREVEKRERMGLVEGGKWNLGTLDEVQANMRRVAAYPSGRIRYVKGKVEQTLHPTSRGLRISGGGGGGGESAGAALPERVALLRLDTDWHDSTKEELEVLWPRLQEGGLLIVDDYYTWGGARKAVDAWLRRRGWTEAARQAPVETSRPAPWHLWKVGKYA